MAKLAIVGTGFIGASFGLAVRLTKLFDHISGYDADRSCSRVAHDRGAIDSVGASARAAVEGAAVVVLAVPDGELPGLLRELGGALASGCIVSDTCTWKLPALEAAAVLPRGVHFISGRPVLDTPGHGPDDADAAIFKNAVYCLTPALDAADQAINAFSSIISSIGAQPYFLGADEHDSLAAATELMPRLVLASLLMSLTGQPTWTEIGRLAGESFGGWTRLAEDGLGSAFWPEAKQNAARLEHWMDAAASRLLELKAQLTGNMEPDATGAWEATLSALGQWHQTKRQLQAGTMPPLSELRPNLLGVRMRHGKGKG